jgi:iron(III) transport system ATP-binding protein
VLLSINNINCRYDDKVIVSDLSFSVASGEITCLLGPSGCGKTTVLRAIAGFEKIYAGSIELEGTKLSDSTHMLAPEHRQVGMVFQDYALFPHLSIRDNIGFGLHKLSSVEKNSIVQQMLALVKLEEYADDYPHQLSGGQQQRVALARALAPNPKVLLMDEPFSNLDTKLRRTLSLEVRDILKQKAITTILVTHDQVEAFNVADTIGLINAGELQQWGTAQTLLEHPENQFVADFISQE